MPEPLDVPHEQVSRSTTAQLLARKAVLDDRLKAHGGLRLDQLSEYHLIKSELYCRQNGIQSQPGVIYRLFGFECGQ
jgi:hypothetical protein